MAIRFKGFTDTSSVALSVTSGGITQSASIPSWGIVTPTSGDEIPAMGTPQGTVSIEVMRQSDEMVAPAGVFLNVSTNGDHFTQATNFDDYDPSFWQVFYRIDWGESSVSDKVVNLPLGHNQMGISYGKRAGHVYTTPGSYTITVDAWGPDGGGGIE